MSPLRAAISGWVGRCLLLAAVLALLLAVLVWVSHATRQGILFSERYTVPFTGIDCAAPPQQDHTVFLAEVQYLSDLPDRLPLLDDGLPRRLADAFAKHPWVAKVERVEITPQRQIHVALVFRTPVLTVLSADSTVYIEVPSGKEGTKELAGALAVDGAGVLLPREALSVGLPVLRGTRKPAAGPAGVAWGDSGVEAAARTAAFLLPHRDRLEVRDLETTEDGVVLTLSRVGSSTQRLRVIWGKAPGGETAEEASAAVKLQRLLDYHDKASGIDLRAKDKIKVLAGPNQSAPCP